MEAYLDWQNKSGGIKLNDVIEEFKYVYKGQEIKAGDFVNYINGIASKADYGESVDTQINSTEYSGYTISAVALDDNRVFVAHSHTSGQLYLYGMICTIKGSTITYGDNIQLSTARYSGYRIALVKLDSNRVFIAHGQDATNHYLYGMLVTIDGTTITKDTDAQLSTIAFSGAYISAELLPNGNIFIAHDYNSSNRYLYGMVVTIDGNTIIAGTDTVISSSTKTGVTISTCLLPNGNVFIAHSYGSNYILYGIVVSIDGTTITKGSDTKLSSNTTTANNVKALLLPSGKIFVAHSKSSYSQLYALICTVSGTSITYGEDFLISSANYSAIGMSLALLQNNNVFIAHKDSNNNSSLYGIVCKVEDTTITQGTDTQLNASLYMGDVTSTLLLDNGTIFIAHSNSTSYYLNAQIFGIDYENNVPTKNIVITEYEQQVTPATEPPFNAIALSSGEGAPEFVEGEVEVTKTGNIFPTSWDVVTSPTKYKSSDGYILDSDSVNKNGNIIDATYQACDNSASTCWGSGSTGANTHWISITCPTPQKITKMKTRVNSDGWYYAVIQGRKEGGAWIDLNRISVPQDSLSEVTLSNVDYYTYYRIYFQNMGTSDTSYVYEWQASEYIGTETQLIPNPNLEHNEQVKIARVYKEIEKEVVNTDNLFASKTWSAITNYQKYQSSDGYIVEGSSYTNSERGILNAFDNNLDTSWMSQNGTQRTIKLTCPQPIKITKMKTYIRSQLETFSQARVRGSFDGATWTTLYTLTSEQENLTELVLSNTDFYSYYQLIVNISSASYSAVVYEWQTSEYIEKVTEVIQ